MQHPFDALRGEYERLLAACQVTKSMSALVAAKRILPLKSRYEAVSVKTGVPILWLMAINERESGSSLFTYLGNGQSLRQVTTEVPRGRGPFDNWEAGAEDALHYDHIDQVTDWDWLHALYEEEAWNGFGYRAHGVHTPYLWGGTNIQQNGKYVADGQWDSEAWDSQLGTVPLMLTLVQLDPTLDIPGRVVALTTPAAAPSVPSSPETVPQGHDGGDHGVAWLQNALNTLDHAGLVVDGSYGRLTRMAVRDFQSAHGLGADGLAGPLTIPAIEKALEALPSAT